MITRRLVAAVVASSFVLGLAACSSDEPESGSDATEQSGAPTTLDLTGVPVDEICTSLGVVHDFYQGLAATGLTYPEVREYIDAEVPGTIEAMRAAAEKSPEPLAGTLEDLADRSQENYDAGAATESEQEYMTALITPDPVAAALFVDVDEFADAECGFSVSS